MQVTVYIATSLDGFIAREDGGLDWLQSGSPNDEEDYGWEAFIQSVDAIVMGRTTFDQVMQFDAWPYGETPVHVLTHRPLELPTNIQFQISVHGGEPEKIHQTLQDQGTQHVYLDGGKTVQTFLRARLVDRLIITRVPILLGRGIPLFGPLDRDCNLNHVRTQSYPSGFVQSEYLIR